MGILSLPTFILYDVLQTGKLVPILEEYELPIVHLNVVYPNTKYTNAKVRTFIDFLVEYIGEKPFWDNW